jgi:hypothetical protein
MGGRMNAPAEIHPELIVNPPPDIFRNFWVCQLRLIRR